MAEVQGSAITPCLKEAMVYLAHSELHTEATQVLKLLTGQDQSQSTFWRLAQEYGAQVEALLEEEESVVQPCPNEVVYCMADGSMLFTDDAWQEVKLGRVFIDQRRSDPCQERAVLEASQYAAHLGDHQAFEQKLDRLLQGYRSWGKRVVCISDGAVWLKQYWQQTLPDATLILDFWHVLEKLGEVARVCLGDELSRQLWLKTQDKLLKNSQLDVVKKNILSLPVRNETAQERIRLTVQYLEKNAFRMDYQQYLQQGLRIGSGAMEAAHRTVIQSRMKRSGQRWSDRGAQNLLNLRVTYKSGKAKLVKQLITGKSP